MKHQNLEILVKNHTKRFLSRRKKAGFTLLETLVVTGIVTLLFSAAVGYYLKAKDNVKDSNCLLNMHKISIALTTYAEDHNYFFPATYDSTYTDSVLSDNTICEGGIPKNLGLLVQGGYLDITSLGCPKSNYADTKKVKDDWRNAITSGGTAKCAFDYRGNACGPIIPAKINSQLTEPLLWEHNQFGCGTNEINEHYKNKVQQINVLIFDGTDRQVNNEKTCDYPEGIYTLRNDEIVERNRVIKELKNNLFN